MDFDYCTIHCPDEKFRKNDGKVEMYTELCNECRFEKLADLIMRQQAPEEKDVARFKETAASEYHHAVKDEALRFFENQKEIKQAVDMEAIRWWLKLKRLEESSVDGNKGQTHWDKMFGAADLSSIYEMFLQKYRVSMHPAMKPDWLTAVAMEREESESKDERNPRRRKRMRREDRLMSRRLRKRKTPDDFDEKIDNLIDKMKVDNIP